MTTLDYILGDPIEKNAKKREQENTQKKKKQEEDTERKKTEAEKKEREMKEMTEKITEEKKTNAYYFGLISTVIFMIFAIMHISLSLDQYAVPNMNKFNRAVTLATLPQINDELPLAPK